MQIDRLLEITFILLDKGQATAGELAERFGVSTRTIYRDLDTLSVAGIPVTTSRGSGGGISLLPGYTVDKSVLSQTERRELLAALQGLNATRLADVDGLLGKLGGLFAGGDSPPPNWIEVDFSGWGSGPGEKEKFASLKQAILSGRVVRFVYLDSQGHRTGRQVEPLRLVFKSHSWYLQGWCRQRQAHRLYKLTRIRALEVTDEGFTPKPPEAYEVDMPRGSAPYIAELRLRFSPKAAYRVYDEFDEREIEAAPDGSLLVQARYPLDGWVVGHLLSFGAQLEVLEPDMLRRALAQQARLLLKKYR